MAKKKVKAEIHVFPQHMFDSLEQCRETIRRQTAERLEALKLKNEEEEAKVLRDTKEVICLLEETRRKIHGLKSRQPSSRRISTASSSGNDSVGRAATKTQPVDTSLLSVSTGARKKIKAPPLPTLEAAREIVSAVQAAAIKIPLIVSEDPVASGSFAARRTAGSTDTETAVQRTEEKKEKVKYTEFEVHFPMMNRKRIRLSSKIGEIMSRKDMYKDYIALRPDPVEFPVRNGRVIFPFGRTPWILERIIDHDGEEPCEDLQQLGAVYDLKIATFSYLQHLKRKHFPRDRHTAIHANSEEGIFDIGYDFKVRSPVEPDTDSAEIDRKPPDITMGRIAPANVYLEAHCTMMDSSLFYFTLVQDEKEMAQMTAALKKEVQMKEVIFPKLDQIAVGTFVLVQTHGQWERARVLAVTNEKKIDVVLIDSGKLKLVKLKNIRLSSSSVFLRTCQWAIVAHVSTLFGKDIDTVTIDHCKILLDSYPRPGMPLVYRLIDIVPMDVENFFTSSAIRLNQIYKPEEKVLISALSLNGDVYIIPLTTPRFINDFQDTLRCLPQEPCTTPQVSIGSYVTFAHHRALVMKKDGDYCELFMIDRGIVIRGAPIEDCRRFPTEKLHHAREARRVKIRGACVEEEGKCDLKKIWSDHLRDKLFSIIHTDVTDEYDFVDTQGMNLYDKLKELGFYV